MPWFVAAVVGVVIVALAYLLAAAGDEGDANIGAGVLGLAGIAVTVIALLGLLVTAVAALLRRRQ